MHRGTLSPVATPPQGEEESLSFGSAPQRWGFEHNHLFSPDAPHAKKKIHAVRFEHKHLFSSPCGFSLKSAL